MAFCVTAKPTTHGQCSGSASYRSGIGASSDHSHIGLGVPVQLSVVKCNGVEEGVEGGTNSFQGAPETFSSQEKVFQISLPFRTLEPAVDGCWKLMGAD